MQMHHLHLLLPEFPDIYHLVNENVIYFVFTIKQGIKHQMAPQLIVGKLPYI